MIRTKTFLYSDLSQLGLFCFLSCSLCASKQLYSHHSVPIYLCMFVRKIYSCG